jgi:hypothetical protein
VRTVASARAGGEQQVERGIGAQRRLVGAEQASGQVARRRAEPAPRDLGEHVVPRAGRVAQQRRGHVGERARVHARQPLPRRQVAVGDAHRLHRVALARRAFAGERRDTRRRALARAPRRARRARRGRRRPRARRPPRRTGTDRAAGARTTASARHAGARASAARAAAPARAAPPPTRRAGRAASSAASSRASASASGRQRAGVAGEHRGQVRRRAECRVGEAHGAGQLRREARERRAERVRVVVTRAAPGRPVRPRAAPG